jgi:hypothetical protein
MGMGKAFSSLLIAIAGGHARQVHAFIRLNPDELPGK